MNNNNNNKVTFFPSPFAHTPQNFPPWKTGSCLPTALIGLSIYCQHHHNNCPKRPLAQALSERGASMLHRAAHIAQSAAWWTT